MFCQIVKLLKSIFSFIIISASLFLPHLAARKQSAYLLVTLACSGIIDLPTALRFPDGELVITQQLHKSLARSGISFQALPRVGVFRYTGHGVNGGEATAR